MADNAENAEKTEAAAEKPQKMRAFAGNSYDDYYDHAMSDYPWTARVLQWIVCHAVWLWTKLVWPWKIEEAERLTEDVRGRVIIMNHVSMLDPVIVVPYLLMHGVPVRTVYKSEFDKMGIATWLFSRVGGIPVARGTADMKLLRRCKASLKRGECVLIYPEGTRVRSDDQPSEIHGGYALIAQMGKAPVQPVAIVGARDLHFRSKVYLKVGSNIEWGDLVAKKRKEQVAEMEKLGMDRVFELRAELRNEHPDKE